MKLRRLYDLTDNSKQKCDLREAALSEFYTWFVEYIYIYCTAIYVDEDDIARYTIKSIDDPRTLNKTVYIRPPKNILSQREVVQVWENLIGKELQKSSTSEQEFLATLRGN